MKKVLKRVSTILLVFAALLTFLGFVSCTKERPQWVNKVAAIKTEIMPTTRKISDKAFITATVVVVGVDTITMPRGLPA